MMKFRLILSLATAAFLLSSLSTNWQVQAAVKKGYLGGYADGTFKSSANVTRAEMIAILSRMSKSIYYATFS